MNDFITLNAEELTSASGGDSVRAQLVRKEIHNQFGDVQMTRKTHFEAPPMDEGISTATGAFRRSAIGIPSQYTFTATVDSIRRRVDLNASFFGH